MGLSSKTLNKRSGFSLLELLVATGMSSLILLLLTSLFRVGMWEIDSSSGRIALVRRGRLAIDSVQRYLSGACEPGIRLDSLGNQAQAIIVPLELDDLESPDPDSRVRFFTPLNHLEDDLLPGARELQMNPQYFAYEIAAIPGANNQGQDLVLRRYQVPPVSGDPVTPDTTVEPRVLARKLGAPDTSSTTGYSGGFEVRHLRQGALRIQVSVSSDLLSDQRERTKLESARPLRIKMSSIYQLPYYNVQ